LAFLLSTGNPGTWMCQEGALEHGCDYAPVAGKTAL